ncbi:MAG: ABC transporter permease, partial [Lachnospiraceae bacterium]|nr:ABC transporter permease [Lachnospiraceae bacterium]
LLHVAYLLLQVEIAGVCFGISAFMRRGTAGVGLGVAILLYFINLIANLSENAKFLRYITPFAYADGVELVVEGRMDTKLVCLGMFYAAAGIAAAFFWYNRKDIM